MSAFSDVPKTLRNASVASGRQNNDRRFPNIKGRAPHKHGLRRQVAAEKAAQRASRSAAVQLAMLDHRLGVGVGAKRERGRLARQIRSGS